MGTSLLLGSTLNEGVKRTGGSSARAGGAATGRKVDRTTNALFLARTRDAREAVIQDTAHWITELNAKKLV